MPQKNPFINQRYDAFFNEYYDPLCRFCIKMVHSKESVEDIVQEQFAYLWENWERLQSFKNLPSYMYKAVKNASINYLIKTRRQYNEIDLESIHESYEESNLPNPQELIEKKDLETLLEIAINELPEHCRNIFTLKRFAELSNKEIAEKLDISIKTVEAQTTIAMRRLKTYLSAHWEGLVFLLLSIF